MRVRFFYGVAFSCTVLVSCIALVIWLYPQVDDEGGCVEVKNYGVVCKCRVVFGYRGIVKSDAVGLG